MNEKEFIKNSIKNSKIHVSALEKSILSDSKAIGKYVRLFIQYAWEKKAHDSYSHLKSILSLAKKYKNNRLNSACKRAVYYAYYSPDIIKHILYLNLDSLPLSINSDIYGQKYLLFDNN